MTLFGIALVVGTTLFPALQLVGLPGITDQLALFSQYLGLASLILMAWGQILSTRFAGMEAIFGGLDRVYVLHKWAGIAAMATLLLHDTIDADMRNLGPEGPLNDLAETLGEISLYGLLILVVISVATFIPYQLWKWTHKAMGALFAAGTFHFFFIMKPFAMGDPAGLYTGAFCAAGLLAYAWTLLPEALRSSVGYEIDLIEETGGALAVTLRPQGRVLKPAPGQFGVVRFTGAGEREPHPFTFSRIGEDGRLRVSVKALGDFTRRLPERLAEGQDVRIHGPYGRFRMPRSGPQVWIAGGIGVTPFLTWIDALSPDAGPVDLFYCARSRDEAPHLAELEARAAALPNLTLHLVFSRVGPRLTADLLAERSGVDLAQAKVFFCGPTPLREALRLGLSPHGVAPRAFHYEEFEFRTGIGLRKLAGWIARRRQAPQPT
ncbi:MAG: ferric reductase-like transmembrane domain-containing protein [Pseudomonadota bacterium]